MSAKSYESGIRPYRLQFVRESTVGTTPSNPAWNFFSDNARMVEPSIDPGTEGQQGLGSPDPQGFFTAVESGQITIEYDLQAKASNGTNTFEDGSNNSNDAVTDGLDRDSDNRIRNTHSIVRRMVQSDLESDNTINGSTSRDTRQYIVAKGGYPASPELTIDPSQANPVAVSLEYECEKIRFIQIDQPTSSESPIEIWANSTDSSDTSQTLTVESEDASTSEDLSLNGTTDVGPTTATFSDIDALSLDSETVGDVRVYVDDGTGTAKGDQIAVIRGQDYYQVDEGDLGVPALGSGSNASAIGQSYELPPNVTIERPDGTAIADEVGTSTISVSNNIESTARGGTQRPALSANGRESTAEGTIFGEVEHYNSVDEMLGVVSNHLRHEFSGGTIRLDNAVITEASGDESAEQSKKEIDVTYEGEGVTIDP